MGRKRTERSGSSVATGSRHGAAHELSSPSPHVLGRGTGIQSASVRWLPRSASSAPPGYRSAAKPTGPRRGTRPALPPAGCRAASRSGGSSNLPVAGHGDVTRRLTHTVSHTSPDVSGRKPFSTTNNPPRFKSEIEFVCSSMSLASNLLQFPVFFLSLARLGLGRRLIRF